MTTLDAVNHKDLLRGCSLLAVLLWSLAPGTSAAQSESEEEDEPLFRVHRIEVSTFGGWMAGDTYLELPAPYDPQRTFDTAADLVLDFDGNPANTLAPRKELETGWISGGMGTFYLSPNFGLQLFGAYGQADAVLSGQVSVEDPTRFERDRTSVGIFNGGGAMIYHIGRERKMPVRPYVTLGLGGVLNRFENAEDPTAVYFRYGGGITFPVFSNFRGLLSFTNTLYRWETDEVARDETVQMPAVSLGVTWRYEVPEDLPSPGDELPPPPPQG